MNKNINEKLFDINSIVEFPTKPARKPRKVAKPSKKTKKNINEKPFDLFGLLNK